MTLIAGVDSSTQSCKVVVRDLVTGSRLRSGRATHPTGTEVHPDAWWSALLEAIADAGGLTDVAAISIAGQQHGMIVLDESGQVIRPALLWNDTRSARAAEDLIAEVGAAEFAERVGSVPVASFTATKLRWLRDNEPENAAKVAAVALPHDWLTWRLRGFGPAGSSRLGPVLSELTTDRSDASGTAYWSAASASYDLDLFERALGHRAVLPRVLTAAAAAAGVLPLSANVPNEGFLGDMPRQTGQPVASASESPSFGTFAGTGMGTMRARARASENANESGGERERADGINVRTDGIIVGAGAGDNAAAALGLGATPGDVVVSLGTSGTVFAVSTTPTIDPTGTIAGFADASGVFLPLIATLNAARCLDSISALLGVDHHELGELALSARPGSDGLVLVPWFEGERTPNRPDATATLSGMTLSSTTRPNLARATIEGMLCGLAAGLDALRASGVIADRLMLIGGSAQNPAVSAIAAQVFDVPIVVPEPSEYVADGAAVQAAWALTGERPDWSVPLVASLRADCRPIIRDQYDRVVRSALASGD